MDPEAPALTRANSRSNLAAIFLASVQEYLVDRARGLAGRVTYQDFSLSRSHVLSGEFDGQVVRHVASEVRTIADGKIGRRTALLTAFSETRAGAAYTDHMSVRLESHDPHGQLVGVWRQHFRFAPQCEKTPRFASEVTLMVEHVANVMDDFIRRGLLPDYRLALPGFELL